MASTELTPDQKGQASLTLGAVIISTRNNFPDSRYRPIVHKDTPYYHICGIDPRPYQVWPTVDGIGTKPDLAERLADAYSNPSFFENLAFDTFAMIESDVARFGYFLPGIANIIDVNTATPAVISALARGAKRACDEGQFAMLNGETAELGYRVSGYGDTHVNWGAFGLMLLNPEKFILGDQLESGQPIVGIREFGIRSNGLSKARNIHEAAYLHALGCPSKKDYFMDALENDRDLILSRLLNMLPESLRDSLQEEKQPFFNKDNLFNFLDRVLGHDFSEQMLIPWHDLDTDAVQELLRPSTLYGKLMYAAQGGVDGPREVVVTAAAHISGGGVPEKVKRMVEHKGLGANIRTIFPDPVAVEQLMKLAEDLPLNDKGEKIIDNRSACEQWNRGIGFVMATKTREDARKLIDIAYAMGYQADVVGKIINEPVIKWRGEKWDYKP